MTQIPAYETLLGGLSPEQFIAEYWQKKPHLIRQAWPGITTPIAADELAGLACEQSVDSRLVTSKDDTYLLTPGPQDPDIFSRLPDAEWTLLVSDIEKWLPALNHLLKPFDFMPDWRIDDLMISYATDGGSVGPHVDEYDVFLLQLSGQRVWQTGNANDDKTLRDDCELAVLQDFNASESWTLDPGDMLYLPPGVPHHGVAVGECMTASIGFRAPLVQNLVMDYAAYLTAQSPTRFTDPNLRTQSHPAELTKDALNQIKKGMQEMLQESDHLPKWAGEFLTASNEEVEERQRCDFQEFEQRLNAGTKLLKNSWSKLLYRSNATELTLFADAISFNTDIQYLEQIQLICERDSITLQDLTNPNIELLELLYQLYIQGTLNLEHEL